MKLSRQLKRARVPTSDLVRFYTCCIRSVCDYTLPVFHSPLLNYLINDLERVQKRALPIICPHLSYNESLTVLPTWIHFSIIIVFYVVLFWVKS